LEQARYAVKREPDTPLGRAAWHAANPAQGYDAYVSEAGVSLLVNQATPLTLTLRGAGYGSGWGYVATGEVSGEGRTLRIEHDNNLHEWFVNRETGLEQGFSLDEPPGGAKLPGQKLRLALAVSVGWHAAATAEGQRISLRESNTGASMRYEKLAAWDINGKTLPSRMLVEDERIVLEIDDEAASYPLTIDPTYVFPQKIVAASENGELGSSVALSTRFAVIGAPSETVNGNLSQGAVYIFERLEGKWELHTKLLARTGKAADRFGRSVAISGDTLVVGAPGPDLVRTGDPLPQGFANVYTLNEPFWVLLSTLSNEPISTRRAFAAFGTAVAVRGNLLAIGAPGDTEDITSPTGQGIVYVYARNGLSLSLPQRLTANDKALGDRFGTSVAISVSNNPFVERSFVLVGAPGDDSQAGAAYVFVRSGTNWTQQVKLFANDRSGNAGFGTSVATSGETVLAGAPRARQTNGSLGAVYTFSRNLTTWIVGPKFVAKDSLVGEGFGQSIDLFGSRAIVGAPVISSPAIGTGSVYGFNFINSAWEQTDALRLEDGRASDGFGSSVALDGENILVGAPNHSELVGPVIARGAAYSFVSPKAMASASAATYGFALAPDSIVAAFGTNLATATAVGTSVPLPTTLAGSSVRVRDRLGIEKVAPLFFVSATQINYLMPAGLATGPASVLAVSGTQSISLNTVNLTAVAPGLFSANADGRGIAAALVLRVKADGSLVYEPLATFDAAQGRFVAVPINVSRANEQVFLVMFGTGFRGNASLANVKVKIGGADAEVLYAGAQGGLVGLDQLNVRLNPNLAGRNSEVDVQLTVANTDANTVRVAVQ
jgi:uncharacterized protein (TIGR03437 family)